MAAKIFTIILLFLVTFNVKLSFIPINSLAIVGSICFLYWCIASKSAKFYKKQIKTLGIIFGLFLLSFGTSIYNNYFDFYFFQEVVLLNILRLFAAFGLSKLLISAFGSDYNLSKLISILCLFALIQLFIAYISFLVPGFYHLIARITTNSKLELSTMTGLLGNRPFGIGNYAFFGAGVYNCILLCLISYTIAYHKTKSIWFLFCYILVSILGTIIARTTIIGIVLSFFIFVLTKYGKRTVLKLGLSITLIWILLGSISFNKDVAAKIQTLSNFGFELFINYSETGRLQTSSSNYMFENMYTFPKNTDTWIIGDGRFRGSETSYYMNTDIGFIRLIYYFGLSGLLLFLFYQYYLIRNAGQIFTSNKRIMMLLLFSQVIILNLKGFTDLSFFLLLLMNINPNHSLKNICSRRSLSTSFTKKDNRSYANYPYR